jgi:hypothetical protein
MYSEPSHDSSGLVLLSMKQVCEPNFPSAIPPDLLPTYRSIARWITSYLMSAHPDLGRAGDVCPFTAQAFRLDTIRIGASKTTSANIIKSTMHDCFRQFALIPTAKSMQHFRTIIVGFPGINDERGLEALKTAQAQLKFHCLPRGLMLGRFHAGSNDPGLWNPDFRPLRSPIPLLAIREVVEADAPFAMRHPLLVPAYVWKYPLAAPKRLIAHLLKSR